jgi:dTMP kinase
MSTAPGKLVAVEGIDGSGKHTQVRLLAEALLSQGHHVFSTGFPQYSSTFGKMVGQFLNGDFGPLHSVDPHFTALLYAGDRFESKRPIVAAIEQGQVVIADRYIASNLAHQTARVVPEKHAAFCAWVEHLEYGIYGLPKEDLVLYLRVPPLEAQSLVAKKSARAYTDSAHDILEADLRHLQDASEMYDQLSQRANWKVIECFDSAARAMRTPEQISSDILAAVQLVLPSLQEKR